MDEIDRAQSQKFTPSAVRYIKLGQGNAWAANCLTHGYLALGHDQAPHDLCQAGDWVGVEDAIGTARGLARPRMAAREV